MISTRTSIKGLRLANHISYFTRSKFVNTRTRYKIMFQRNRNSTAVNKLTFRIKFAFVKLFYTYAMRDNLSKPSNYKSALCETKQSFWSVYDTYKISLKSDAIANTTDGNQLTFPSVTSSQKWLGMLNKCKA